MANIFEERTFNENEQSAIKSVVDDTIECLNQIKDLQDHIKENTKDVCDRLNENYDDKSMHIKPKLIVKLAKTKIKEDMQEQKEGVKETETGLELIYK